MLFIEIQPLYCFRGKMCRKLEKWDPLMGSHLNAQPSTNRSVPNIVAQLSAEKQWVGGGGCGGVYYTRPSLPILIKYKQQGVRIRVKHYGYEMLVLRQSIKKDKILLRYTKTWDTHPKIYIFNNALSNNTKSWWILQQKLYQCKHQCCVAVAKF